MTARRFDMIVSATVELQCEIEADTAEVTAVYIGDLIITEPSLLQAVNQGINNPQEVWDACNEYQEDAA